MKKTAELRKILNEEQLVVGAGAHDALSAKVIEKAGFKVLLLSGFGFEASLLGNPDAGLLSMTEVVTHGKNIASAVKIPTLADAEAGFGGPSSIQRTIRELEKAGIAGVFIEDQDYPVFCGSLKKYKRIISMEEMVMKIKCALDAREDPDFLICGRTDADIVSLEEQIRRCKAYAEAGADMVTAMPQNRQEFEALAKAVDHPLWLYLWPGTDITPKDLEAMGVRGLVIFPVELLFVATKAMMDVAEEIKTKGTTNETFAKYQSLDYRSFFEFIGLRDVVDTDKRYSVQQAEA